MDIYPEIEPFYEDYLSVDNLHKIHFALYGNPKGRPVFFIHGGPGGGCEKNDARWFNPEKYLIVLHDQRGSGESLPFNELKNNDTFNIIEDIEKLRKHLKIKKKIFLFGGSWGSTVSLLYAEKYPENVFSMLLRSVFTCTYDEQDYLYSNAGAARYSPKEWEDLIKKIPNKKARIQDFLFDAILKKDNYSKILCKKLAYYEMSFFVTTDADLVKNKINCNQFYNSMLLNLYFQKNRFFIEDGIILKNAKILNAIPLKIIHGKNDIICPPIIAWNLHKAGKGSKLVFVNGAGHTSKEINMKNALLSALFDLNCK